MRPSVLASVCEIVAVPLPPNAPVIFTGAGESTQLKVVPLTPFGLVIEKEAVCPEQIVWLADMERLGIGLTVTVYALVVPVQPFKEGTTE